MELTPIGKEKLEVALTRKDMERFHLTAERLDYKYYILRRLLFEKKQHLGDCGVTGRL